MRNITAKTLFPFVLGTSLVIAGQAFADTEQRLAGSAKSRGSLIAYLTREHDDYKQITDLNSAPYAITLNGDEIYWDIYADDARHAEKLKSHIEFMGAALENGAYPRNWDKFFVIDAEMHEFLHTKVTLDGQRVTVSKRADNACAYTIAQIHAQVVSEEFFANGDITNDHSAIADEVVASEACADFRERLEASIDENWEPR